MLNFARMLKQCKYNGGQLLGSNRIHEICRRQGYRWRDGKLPPDVTVLGMTQQMAHTNISCAAMGKMHDGAFTAEAFCQARMRLPLGVLDELNLTLANAVMHALSHGGYDPCGRCSGRHSSQRSGVTINWWNIASRRKKRIG